MSMCNYQYPFLTLGGTNRCVNDAPEGRVFCDHHYAELLDQQMKDGFFLLVRVDFDSLESMMSSHQESFTNIGLFSNHEEIQKWFRANVKEQTKAYNGKYYPRFEVQELKVIS